MVEFNGLPNKKKKPCKYSNLDEDIIHHIFSFLTRREAVKTSLLCKSWRQAWMSYPVLKFDEIELLPNMKKDSVFVEEDLISKIVDDSMETFVSNFSACGNRNKPIMQKFHLSLFGCTCIKYSLIEKWVSMALESRVQDLYFNNEGRITKDGLCIPKTVFSAKFLRSLGLMDEVKVPRLEIKDVDLYSLRSLSINTFFIDHQTLRSILLGCPLLENLNLACRVAKIKISDFRNLKRLTIGGFNEVEITKLPCLDSLCILSYPPPLVNLSIDDTRHNIKYLSLVLGVKPHDGINDTWLCKYMSKFPCVERLNVDCVCHLKFLRLRLPRIKKIHFTLSGLCREGTIYEGSISAPSPFSFGLIPLSSQSVSIKAFVLMMHRPSVFMTRYWISISNRDEYSWSHKLRQHLLNISHDRSTLSFSIMEKQVVKRLALRLALYNPFRIHTDPLLFSQWDEETPLNLQRERPACVEELGLDTIVANPSRYLAILRSLFSICHPKILCVNAAKEHKDFIKVMCEGFIGRGDLEYWQRRLIDAKIEEIVGIKKAEGYGPMELDALINLLPALKEHHEIYFRLRWIAS